MAKIAFVLGQDFEDSEFRRPYDALKAAGHELTVVGARRGEDVTGKRGRETFRIEATPRDVEPQGFAAVVIPGGYSPDHLRTDEEVVGFVRRMAEGDKVVAAICHGGSLLIEANVVRGRRLTSWPSIRTDLRNAGADWEDRSVVTDRRLVTSRKPDDIDAFVAAIRNLVE
jgi:protease I